MPHELVDGVRSAFNNQDGAALVALMADDGYFEDFGWGGAVYPAERAGDLISFIASFVQDFSLTFSGVLSNGTNFATEWEIRATVEGSIEPFGIVAKGKPVIVKGSLFLETDGRRIKRASSHWSILDLLHQLDAPITTNVAWGLAYMAEAAGGLGDSRRVDTERQ